MIVGDFNWDADECREWVKHTKWQMWVQDFGNTCTTSDSVSAIDYVLVSPQIRGAMVSSESIDSQLATHRPIRRVGFAVKRDQKMRVFEAPTKARPRNTPVIGPQLEDATNSVKWNIWQAQARAIERAATEPGWGDDDLKKALQQQWDEWQRLVGPEAKATFGISHECGKQHEFKWKSTKEIVEEAKPQTSQKRGIYTWILRRIQELLAFERRSEGSHKLSENRMKK
jgi:hypothetical protein